VLVQKPVAPDATVPQVTWPVGHAATHAPPAQTSPPGQTEMHAPPVQLWPCAQIVPHAPQLFGSVLVCVH